MSLKISIIISDETMCLVKKKLNTVPDVDFPDSILTIYEMYNVKKWLNFASN